MKIIRVWLAINFSRIDFVSNAQNDLLKIINKDISFVFGASTVIGNYLLPKFLNQGMVALGNETQSSFDNLKDNFLGALSAAYKIFGKHSFKKSLALPEHKKVVNKPLFESISVCLAELNDIERSQLVNNKSIVISAFTELLQDKEFDLSISKSTANTDNVQARFTEVRRVINSLLQRNSTC